MLLWSGQWQNVSRYCKFPVFSYYGPSQIFVLGSLASKSAPEVKNTLRASTKNPNICQQSLSKGRAGTCSIQPAAGTKKKRNYLTTTKKTDPKRKMTPGGCLTFVSAFPRIYPAAAGRMHACSFTHICVLIHTTR